MSVSLLDLSFAYSLRNADSGNTYSKRQLRIAAVVSTILELHIIPATLLLYMGGFATLFGGLLLCFRVYLFASTKRDGIPLIKFLSDCWRGGGKDIRTYYTSLQFDQCDKKVRASPLHETRYYKLIDKALIVNCSLLTLQQLKKCLERLSKSDDFKAVNHMRLVVEKGDDRRLDASLINELKEFENLKILECLGFDIQTTAGQSAMTPFLRQAQDDLKLSYEVRFSLQDQLEEFNWSDVNSDSLSEGTIKSIYKPHIPINAQTETTCTFLEKKLRPDSYLEVKSSEDRLIGSIQEWGNSCDLDGPHRLHLVFDEADDESKLKIGNEFGQLDDVPRTFDVVSVGNAKKPDEVVSYCRLLVGAGLVERGCYLDIRDLAPEVQKELESNPFTSKNFEVVIKYDGAKERLREVEARALLDALNCGELNPLDCPLICEKVDIEHQHGDRPTLRSSLEEISLNDIKKMLKSRVVGSSEIQIYAKAFGKLWPEGLAAVLGGLFQEEEGTCHTIVISGVESFQLGELKNYLFSSEIVFPGIKSVIIDGFILPLHAPDDPGPFKILSGIFPNAEVIVLNKCQIEGNLQEVLEDENAPRPLSLLFKKWLDEEGVVLYPIECSEHHILEPFFKEIVSELKKLIFEYVKGGFLPIEPKGAHLADRLGRFLLYYPQVKGVNSLFGRIKHVVELGDHDSFKQFMSGEETEELKGLSSSHRQSIRKRIADEFGDYCLGKCKKLHPKIQRLIEELVTYCDLNLLQSVIEKQREFDSKLGGEEKSLDILWQETVRRVLSSSPNLMHLRLDCTKLDLTELECIIGLLVEDKHVVNASQMRLTLGSFWRPHHQFKTGVFSGDGATFDFWGKKSAEIVMGYKDSLLDLVQKHVRTLTARGYREIDMRGRDSPLRFFPAEESEREKKEWSRNDVLVQIRNQCCRAFTFSVEASHTLYFSLPTPEKWGSDYPGDSKKYPSLWNIPKGMFQIINKEKFSEIKVELQVGKNPLVMVCANKEWIAVTD